MTRDELLEAGRRAIWDGEALALYPNEELPPTDDPLAGFHLSHTSFLMKHKSEHLVKRLPGADKGDFVGAALEGGRAELMRQWVETVDSLFPVPPTPATKPRRWWERMFGGDW